MPIEVAEQLKQQWTDKYVVVVQDVLELRRFVGLTGLVKTVNMSGRALVQFDGPEDIGWYDIDPAYLTEVGAPVKNQAVNPVATQESTSTAKPVAKRADGQSLLEMARQQGAAKNTAAKAEQQADVSETAEAPKPAGKKLSPLELARQQDGTKSASAEVVVEAAVAEPAVKRAPENTQTATTSPDGKLLSKIELARLQGPFQG